MVWAPGRQGASRDSNLTFRSVVTSLLCMLSFLLLEIPLQPTAAQRFLRLSAPSTTHCRRVSAMALEPPARVLVPTAPPRQGPRWSSACSKGPQAKSRSAEREKNASQPSARRRKKKRARSAAFCVRIPVCSRTGANRRPASFPPKVPKDESFAHSAATSRASISCAARRGIVAKTLQLGAMLLLAR